jgi:hypothetical protein
MNGGDIRREKRCSDHPPSQRPPSQEISLAGQFHLPDGKDPDGQYPEQIPDYNDEVKQRHGQFRSKQRLQTPSFPVLAVKESVGFGMVGESHITGIPTELGIGTDRHISQKDRFC